MARVKRKRFSMWKSTMREVFGVDYWWNNRPVCDEINIKWHLICSIFSIFYAVHGVRLVMKKDVRGFTLIEIVMVVAVVGLLGTLGTLSVLRAMQSKRIKTAEAEVHQLSLAILQLAWDTGKWPNGEPRNGTANDEMEDLSILTQAATPTGFDNWRGPYYEGSLVDPWDQNYYFDPDYTSNGVTFVAVGSGGANKSEINTYDQDNIIVRLDD